MWALLLLLLQLLAETAAAPRLLPTGSSGNRWRSLSCFDGTASSCDCSGSSDGKTQIKSSATTTLQRLRNQYENCTRVWGNLEIIFIDREVLDEEKADPSKALQFLETIEEVTGYVLIFGNDVSRISLPKLRIVWGDTLYYDVVKQSANLTFADPKDGVGFFVYNNPNLEYIDMPELRSIERGKVVLAHNNYMCYWQQKHQPLTNLNFVDFGQLVGKNNVATRLMNFHAEEMKNFRECRGDTYQCHPNCTSGHCWGPEADMCQIIYRNNCPSSCESEMCSNPGEESQLCCHKACAAGCRGPRPDQCYACKSFEQDGSCVEQCNGLQSFNHATRMTQPHPDPRYTHNRHCVKQCPENTLIQGDHCVTRCREGFFADTEKNDRVCRQCVGPCPKRCPLDEALTSEHIDDLINCTVIEGAIILLQHAMTNFTNFDEDGVRRVRALTEDDLEKLSNVQVITDYLEIQAGPESPNSLKFLRNLREIEGRRLSRSRYAMFISSNDNLRDLGLTSLKSLRKGRVYVGNNRALCYINSINWDKIAEQRPEINRWGMNTIIDNKDVSQCAWENATCDSKCDSTMGCWGAGDRMCLACANWRIGDQCVDSCPEFGFYKDHNTKECLPCHAECHMCIGEGPRKCTSCKHVSYLYNVTDFECLSHCPVTHYEGEKSQCQPCHPACFEFGCTGPSNVPGNDGCNMCRYAEISDETENKSVVHCLPSVSENCAAAGLTNYYRAAPIGEFVKVVEQYVCEKCSPVCSECTGYGDEVIHHNCKCKTWELKGNTEFEADRCVPYCPINSYLIKDVQGEQAGVCMSCHKYCDKHSSCKGRTEIDCQKCESAGIYVNESQFECLEHCPAHKPFKDDDLFCHEEDKTALREAKMKLKTVVIGVFIAALLIVILVLAAATFNFYYKYKKEAKKRLIARNQIVTPNLTANNPSASTALLPTKDTLH